MYYIVSLIVELPSQSAFGKIDTKIFNKLILRGMVQKMPTFVNRLCELLKQQFLRNFNFYTRTELTSTVILNFKHILR